MTLKMFVTIIIMHIFEWAVIVGHEPENSDINCDLETANKYSKENNRWEEYLDNVEKAASDYVACNVEACSSCHDRVITADLATFSEGISKEMVNKAGLISRTTKYQIIGGKLYRSQDCMFPFRYRKLKKNYKCINEKIVGVREFNISSSSLPLLSQIQSSWSIPGTGHSSISTCRTNCLCLVSARLESFMI